MQCRIKSRLVQVNLELDDKREAAYLLKDAIEKETSAHWREVGDFHEHSSTRMKEAVQAQHIVLSKSLGEVDVRRPRLKNIAMTY